MSRQRRKDFLVPDETGELPLHREIRKDPPFSGLPKRVKFAVDDFEEIDGMGQTGLVLLAEAPAACQAVGRCMLKGERFTPAQVARPVMRGRRYTSRITGETRAPSVVDLKADPAAQALPSPFHAAVMADTLPAFLAILPKNERSRVSVRTLVGRPDFLSREDRKNPGGRTSGEISGRARQLCEAGLVRDQADVTAWETVFPEDRKQQKDVRQAMAGLAAYLYRRRTKTRPNTSRQRNTR